MNAHLNAKHAAAHGHAGIIVAPLLACVVVPANAAMPGHYVIGPVEQHQMLVTAAPMPLAKPMKKRKLRLDQHEPMAQQRVHMPMAHPGYAHPGHPPPHLVQHAPPPAIAAPASATPVVAPSVTPIAATATLPAATQPPAPTPAAATPAAPSAGTGD